MYLGLAITEVVSYSPGDRPVLMRLSDFRSVTLLTAAVAGLAAVLISAEGGSTRQSSQAAAAIDRLEQWIGAVRVHVIGEADSQATIAALWTHDEVAELFPCLEALLQLGEAPTRQDLAPSPQVRLARPVPVPAQRRLYRLSTGCR